MKKNLLLLVAILLGSGLGAQNRVIDIRPAHAGKDLSLEEAVFKGVGYSRAPGFQIQDDGTVT